jgi:iron complex outermembrane receptor protein
MNTNKRVSSLSGKFAMSLLAAALAPSQSFAQGSGNSGDSGSMSLEEIVVTARRRDESLLEVPISVSAMSEEALLARSIVALDDLSYATPSMYATTQAGTASGFNSRASRTIFFRGLSTSQAEVFFDGAPITSSLSPLFGDVARVEVLRGPQSVYFGRATFSGAVNYVSKDPSMDEFGGRVRLEVSEYDSHDANVAFEGPIWEEKLAARVSLRQFEQGGHYDNFGDPSQTMGDRSTDAISTQILFRPNENLTVKSYITYFEDDDGPGAQAAIKPPEMNCNLGGARGSWFCGEIPDTDELPGYIVSGNFNYTDDLRMFINENSGGRVQPLDYSSQKGFGFSREATQANVRADYEFNNGYTLSYIGALYREDNRQIVDLGFRTGDENGNVLPNVPPFTFIPGAPADNIWAFGSGQEIDNYFHELRVSSPQEQGLRWTVGATYLAEDRIVGPVTGLSPFGDVTVNTVNTTDTDTAAIFGGIYYDLTDKLTLTVEARYQQDEITRQNLSDANGRPVVDAPVFNDTWNTFSPRVSLDWNFSEDSMLYVLWSRGYTPGGFNTGLINVPEDQIGNFEGAGISFDEEQLDNYEISLKSKFLDGRAQTVLTAYYMDWSDGIVSIVFPFITEEGTLNLTGANVNLGQVDLYGVEFEGGYALTENLTLSGMFSYNFTEINEYVCGVCTDIYGNNDAVGNSLRAAPEFAYSLSADYRRALSGGNDLYARLDYNFRDSYYVTDANVAEVGSQQMVNGVLGFALGDKFNVELFGLNLLDETTVQSASNGNDVLFTFGAQTEIRLALPRKRQFGVRATYNF